MLKAQRKVGAKTIIEAEDNTPAEVFANLAALAQVFAHGDTCGNCGSQNVVPQVREPQVFRYFEFQCIQCGCRFPLGQLKEPKGGLFPKHRNEDGSEKPKGGWERYDPEQGVR